MRSGWLLSRRLPGRSLLEVWVRIPLTPTNHEVIMSRTRKEGKRTRRPKVGSQPKAIQKAIWKRHAFGSTEKILRRNRRIWVRLGNKRRRAADKTASLPV